MDNKYNVPFGNSKYQIMHFIANELTPQRAVRKVLLQIDKKTTAYNEHLFRKKRRELRKREIASFLKTSFWKKKKINDFQKELLEIELEEIEFYLKKETALVDDCLEELKIYTKILERLMPECSREQFENSEELYWTKKFMLEARRELSCIGTISKETMQGLYDIGIEPAIKDNKLLFYKKENAKNTVRPEISQS